MLCVPEEWDAMGRNETETGRGQRVGERSEMERCHVWWYRLLSTSRNGRSIVGQRVGVQARPWFAEWSNA